MLTFVLPGESNRRDVLDFYREFEAAGGSCIGFAHHDDYDLWLRGMQNRKTATDLPEGYVQENFYLCYEGDRLAGVFSLKFELTDYLLAFGGHVGYAVRPSMRNRGLATGILAQGLALAKELGFARILAVCTDDNIASERVIRKNGGALVDSCFDPEENVTVRRYWIKLTGEK